ncbi:MAG: glycosyltransferase family 2 protein [Microgenomates group bacterium]
MSVKVFVVIPVFNRLNFSRHCLRDISRQTYKDIETIVIDDGSTDKTFKYIRRHHPQTHVIRGDGNWWWSRSVHEGIEYALAGAGSNDFILLLNNDCFFGSDYIKRLMATADKFPKAVIGSFCVTISKPVRVVEAGIRIDWPNGVVYSVAETISTDPLDYSDIEVVDQLDALPGKGTLFPVKLIRKMGSVNYQRLPHYLADYEFSNRAKKFGYGLLVDVKAVVRHDWEATGYKTDSNSSRLGYKEALRLLFDRKSMNNIIDWLNFVFIVCPEKYLKVNLYTTSRRLTNGLTRVYPLILFRNTIPEIRRSLYRLSRKLKLITYRHGLMIKQFPEYHLKNRKA